RRRREDGSRNASLSGHPRWFIVSAPIQMAAEPHLFQATHGGSLRALRYRRQPNRIYSITRSVSSPASIICTSRERWILPLDVFGIVDALTSSTRAGR